MGIEKRVKCGSWTCFSFQSCFILYGPTEASLTHINIFMMGPGDLTGASKDNISPSLALSTHRENENSRRICFKSGWLCVVVWFVDNEKWISFSICTEHIYERVQVCWYARVLGRSLARNVCFYDVELLKLWYCVRVRVCAAWIWSSEQLSTLNWTKIYKSTSHTTDLSQSVMNFSHINSVWFFLQIII